VAKAMIDTSETWSYFLKFIP